METERITYKDYEVAEALGLNRAVFRKYLDDGLLPFVRIGRVRFVSAEHLRAIFGEPEEDD